MDYIYKQRSNAGLTISKYIQNEGYLVIGTVYSPNSKFELV